MKYRYLSLFLILLILSIGAVCAQEDAVSEDDVAIAQDNTVLSVSEYVIDDNNYNDYFDNGGLILENSNISDGDTIKLGNVSNKDFIIEKSLTITSNSSSDILTNVSFYFFEGSDNSTISGLNFVNHDAEEHAITVMEATNIEISDNVIDVQSIDTIDDHLYAICLLYANNLNIQANSITYVGKTNGTASNSAIRVIESEGVEISFNTISATLSSCDVDWTNNIIKSSGLYFASCDDLVLLGNDIFIEYSNVTGVFDTIYGIYIKESDGVEVSENNLEMLGHKYAYGLSIQGDEFAVSDNEFKIVSDENYACGVDIEGESAGIVDSNTIEIISPTVAYGIYACDWDMDGQVVDYINNEIYGESSAVYGMELLYGEKSLIDGNYITLDGNYTLGIAEIMTNDPAEITNNDINVYGTNTDMVNTGDTVPSITVGIFSMGESIIQNNAITSTGNWTVYNSGYDVEVTDNYLISNELLGDDSVYDTSDDAVVENNIPIKDAVNYNLTNDTFLLFFDNDGWLRKNITAESLTFIGEFSDLSLRNVIDRPIKLLGDNATLYDMSFFIGSDNVVVENFTFISDSLSEIITVAFSDNISILSSDFIVNGVDDDNNAVIHLIGSENSIIDGNSINFNVETNDTYQNIVILAEGSNDLVVSNNNIKALIPARSINWTSGEIYSAGVYLYKCDDSVLEGNFITAESNGQISAYDTLYAVDIIGDNAIVSENTINAYEAPYPYGLVISGEEFMITKNDIFSGVSGDYACGIDIEGAASGIVDSNKIRVFSPKVAYGIYACDWNMDGQTVNYTNNDIYGDAYAVYGMELLFGEEALIDCNGIILYGNYTIGIAEMMIDDVAIVTNNDIYAFGVKTDMEDMGDMVPATTVGIFSMGDSLISGNAITSSGNWTVHNTASDSEITENYLVSKDLLGDDSVNDTSDETIVKDNIPLTNETNYNLTNDTFFLFFDVLGNLRNNITAESLTFIGEFSGLIDVIYIERPITLLGDDAVLYDLGITIFSENVTVENFTFISESLSEIIKIYESDNVSISSSDFIVQGLADHDNTIIHVFDSDNVLININTFNFTVETNDTYKNTAILVEESDDLVIDTNEIISYLPARSIDWGTGTVYSEGVFLEDCNNAILDDNTIGVVSNGQISTYDTIYAAHITGDNVTVINNRIGVIEAPYGYALVITGEDFFIEDNYIAVGENGTYACGIDVESNSNGVINHNSIISMGDSSYGIYTANWAGDVKADITNNEIDSLGNSVFALSLSGSEVLVENNTISVEGNFTTGIASKVDEIIINNNTINSYGTNIGTPLGYDSFGVYTRAIYIASGNATITLNDINATDSGIFSIGDTTLIANNIIEVEDTGVYQDDGLDDSFAIYVSSDAEIRDNTITYSGKTDGNYYNAVIHAEDSNIEVYDNIITAELISCPINWKEIGLENIPEAMSQALYFSLCDDMELVGNDITVEYVNSTGNYDTIYVVNVMESDNALVEDNIIDAKGHTYIYGIVMRGEDFEISGNDIAIVSDENYANGINIEGESTGIVENNLIYLSSPYVAYGIYTAMNDYGDSPTVNYTDNYIEANSHAVYAINVYGSEGLIDGNTIVATGNYTMGISSMMMDDVAVITNNEITVSGLKNDTDDVGDMLPAQTVGILTMYESQVHYNKVTSTGEYSIINSAYDSEITDNYLVSSELLGDESVDDTLEESLVENNIPIKDAVNYNLTNDTFYLFFNDQGCLRDNITAESLTFIGEFSDLTLWNVIDRPVKLLSDNATLYDMSFTIISENVTVDGLSFVSDELAGIINVLQSNVSIVNCDFTLFGVEDDSNWVISVLEADDVLIDGNSITFYVETNETNHNHPIYAKDSNALTISNNFISAEFPARSINWTSGEVYSVAVCLDDCDNAVLDDNVIDVKSNGQISTYDTIYAVNIVGDNATVTLNDIKSTDAPYGYALVLAGEDFNIDGNIISVENGTYACGIDVESNSNGVINENIISVSGDSAYGIYTADWAGDVEADITNNAIIAEGISVFGMSLSGSEALVENNSVTILNGNFTTGIASAIDDIIINNNSIIANGSNVGTPAGYDSMGIETTGVHIVSGNAIVTNNNIIANNKYAVDFDGDGEVTDNEIYADMLTGDFAVDYDQDGDILVANNTPAMELDYILTNDTFYVYFDEEGFIREQIDADNLTFVGEFSNLVNEIFINKPIILLSDNATLNNISMTIISSDVVVDGFNFTGEDSGMSVEDSDNVYIINNNFDVNGFTDSSNVVIDIYNSENVLLENNTINFGVETNGTFSNIAVYAEDSNNLSMIGNIIAAYIPARSINWTSGEVYSQGVFLDNCDNAFLDGNNIGVKANDQISTYDTIYAVNIKGDNATLTDNMLGAIEAPYGYALVMTGENFNITKNMIVAAENGTYACGIDVESNSNGVIDNNLIYAVADVAAYGIYTADWAGDVNVNITDNIILSVANSPFGMSLSGSETLVENNDITVQGNYTTGIASAIDNIVINNNTIIANGSNVGTPLGYDSMGVETTGIHIADGNAIVTNNDVITTGEFAVDLEGTGQVTENYLVADVYTGDASVEYTPDQRTMVQNNTPAMQRAIISANDVVMYYKNGTRYVITLTDQEGTLLSNKTVTISINGLAYNRTTNENGTASLAINLNAGNYTVSASFVGEDYSNATTVNNITVLTTIEGNDVVKMFRNGTQYYATFVDGQGNPLASGTEVTFNINGVMYVRKTNENGTAKLNINLEQGTYILTAIAPNGETHSNNITVLSTIESSDLVKYYKNESQYVVTIYGEDGKAVGAGEEVTFNINGVFYTRTTNATGQAKLNINLQPGDYIITAEYNGCKVSNDITVKPVLTANDLVKKYGTSDQFIAYLVDGQGKPYEGQTVEFNIHGLFYNRTTDADGRAMLNIRLDAAPDVYIITSMYNGCSISNKITVTN